MLGESVYTASMVLHVDMDAFYAAVEQRDDPTLKGKPVVVGGSASGRGVVCAASYEARVFGIHSAMPAATAVRLCPHAVFLSPRMEYYAGISAQIREVFQRYTPVVEPLSLDEAFLDVSGSCRLFQADEQELGRRIQADIRDELGLVASVGVAPNKFLAKVASDLQKPAGFVVVPSDDVQAFLDPLPIERVWGVGKVALRRFHRLGVRTIAELRRLQREDVESMFGSFGVHVWRLSHGLDDRCVEPDRVAKSISHETTLAEDIDNHEVIEAWLLELADQVGRRLRRSRRFGRTVQLKVRFSDFRTVTRADTLVNPTNTTQEIFDAARELFRSRITNDVAVRLIGVGVSSLQQDEVARQKMLFDEEQHERDGLADATIDAIRDKFGSESLSRGTRMLHQTKHRTQPRPE